ncbi:DUF3857 domain-containing protein [Altibacter sp.]|uniref:DUF3857 domain-containing protein n=1 Tax=Altibacter sp. TaxID=2024823 RepID=UPI002583BACB|nr:DUF3857 domain-containing protein [Altibacter sp.]MCW9038235.1 DUF3857 and transglutaminase domain-containing protein [Altibacter sp.]
MKHLHYKTILLSFTLLHLLCTQVYSQQRNVHSFGSPTLNEFSLETYDKEPEAAAVVLYERGKNFFEMVDYRLTLIKEVHRKIKVLNAQKFEGATVEIPWYTNKSSKERVRKLQAMTHNGDLQRFVSEDKIYESDLNEYWNVTKFTFPDVKDGSILEYSYRIESPYFWGFEGWDFQEELPKIYSEFESSIPGNLVYKRSLYGSQKLDVNDVKVKNNCLDFRGTEQAAACEVSVYVMKDIPSLKEEAYMLSPDNYRSRIEYELQQITDFYGDTSYYTKTWDDVDNEFKTEKDMGRQLRYENYFQQALPQHLLGISDALERAKAVYYYIQDHFTWNNKYRIYSDIRVKEAYREQKGNNSEINLALINALNAAQLDAKIFLSATRNTKVPNPLYPVLTDFNYVMAYVKIDNEEYILDATYKDLKFGMVPFKALNDKGRVMDLKTGSFWKSIDPEPKNLLYIKAQILVSAENDVVASVTETHSGYSEIFEKQKLNETSHALYVTGKESRLGGVEIRNLSVANENDPTKELTLDYDAVYEPEVVGDQVFIDPFFLQSEFKENPFLAEDRSFPIDFGYPRSIHYTLAITIDKSFEIERLPENKSVQLPENLGNGTMLFSQNDNTLYLRFTFALNHQSFVTEAYPTLKEFFGDVVNLQTNSFIVLRKR